MATWFDDESTDPIPSSTTPATSALPVVALENNPLIQAYQQGMADNAERLQNIPQYSGLSSVANGLNAYNPQFTGPAVTPEEYAAMTKAPEKVEPEIPIFRLGDAVSGLGSFFEGVWKTTPGAYQQLKHAGDRPDLVPLEDQQIMDEATKFNEEMQQENARRNAAGESSSFGNALRSGGGSGGFTAVAGLGALATGVPVAKLTTAATAPVLGPVAPLAGLVAGTAASMPATYVMADRMAQADFMHNAYKQWETVYKEKNDGKLPGEEEKAKIHEQLKPMAEKVGHAEGFYEAIGNIGTMAGGIGLNLIGKEVLKKMAKSAWTRGLLRVGALGANATTEYGTETYTEKDQQWEQDKLDALLKGKPESEAVRTYSDDWEGTKKAFDTIFEPTTGIMLGMGFLGGAVKTAGKVHESLVTNPQDAQKLVDLATNEEIRSVLPTESLQNLSKLGSNLDSKWFRKNPELATAIEQLEAEIEIRQIEPETAPKNREQFFADTISKIENPNLKTAFNELWNNQTPENPLPAWLQRITPAETGLNLRGRMEDDAPTGDINLRGLSGLNIPLQGFGMALKVRNALNQANPAHGTEPVTELGREITRLNDPNSPAAGAPFAGDQRVTEPAAGLGDERVNQLSEAYDPTFIGNHAEEVADQTKIKSGDTVLYGGNTHNNMFEVVGREEGTGLLILSDPTNQDPAKREFTVTPDKAKPFKHGEETITPVAPKIYKVNVDSWNKAIEQDRVQSIDGLPGWGEIQQLDPFAFDQFRKSADPELIGRQINRGGNWHSVFNQRMESLQSEMDATNSLAATIGAAPRELAQEANARRTSNPDLTLSYTDALNDVVASKQHSVLSEKINTIDKQIQELEQNPSVGRDQINNLSRARIILSQQRDGLNSKLGEIGTPSTEALVSQPSIDQAQGSKTEPVTPSQWRATNPNVINTPKTAADLEAFINSPEEQVIRQREDSYLANITALADTATDPIKRSDIERSAANTKKEIEDSRSRRILASVGSVDVQTSNPLDLNQTTVSPAATPISGLNQVNTPIPINLAPTAETLNDLGVRIADLQQQKRTVRSEGLIDSELGQALHYATIGYAPTGLKSALSFSLKNNRPDIAQVIIDRAAEQAYGSPNPTTISFFEGLKETAKQHYQQPSPVQPSTATPIQGLGQVNTPVPAWGGVESAVPEQRPTLPTAPPKVSVLTNGITGSQMEVPVNSGAELVLNELRKKAAEIERRRQEKVAAINARKLQEAVQQTAPPILALPAPAQVLHPNLMTPEEIREAIANGAEINPWDHSYPQWQRIEKTLGVPEEKRTTKEQHQSAVRTAVSSGRSVPKSVQEAAAPKPPKEANPPKETAAPAEKKGKKEVNPEIEEFEGLSKKGKLNSDLEVIHTANNGLVSPLSMRVPTVSEITKEEVAKDLANGTKNFGGSKGGFQKLDDEAADGIPSFQGNKKGHVKTSLQYIRFMLRKAIPAIKVIHDYFGGGGGWGLAIALRVATNAQELNLYELNQNRALKLQLFYQDGMTAEKFIEIAVKALNTNKKMQDLIQNLAATGKVSSGNFAKHVENILKENQISDQESRAVFQAIVDQGNAGRLTLSGVEKASNENKADALYMETIKLIAKGITGTQTNLAEIRKTRPNFKVKVTQADSYSLEHQQGAHVLSIFDPPYYNTLGYIGNTKVPLSIYNQTEQALLSAKKAGNHIIYTDEVWWATNDGLPIDMAGDGITGRTAHEIYESIRSEIPLAIQLVGANYLERYEILGVYANEEGAAKLAQSQSGSTQRNDPPAANGQGTGNTNPAGTRSTGQPTGSGVGGKPAGKSGKPDASGGSVIPNQRGHIIPADDDLLLAIAKLGGIAFKLRAELGIDDKTNPSYNFGNQAIIKGVHSLFTTNGFTDFDDLARSLSGYGYPVYEDNGQAVGNYGYDGDNKSVTVEAVKAAIKDSLDGKKIFTPSGNEANAKRSREEEEKEQDRRALEEHNDTYYQVVSAKGKDKDGNDVTAIWEIRPVQNKLGYFQLFTSRRGRHSTVDDMGVWTPEKNMATDPSFQTNNFHDIGKIIRSQADALFGENVEIIAGRITDHISGKISAPEILGKDENNNSYIPAYGENQDNPIKKFQDAVANRGEFDKNEAEAAGFSIPPDYQVIVDFDENEEKSFIAIPQENAVLIDGEWYRKDQEDTADRGDIEGEIETNQDDTLLIDYDQEQLNKEKAAKEKADKEQAARDKAADDKAKADKDREGFGLTGSDRPADIAAAQGQEDFLGSDNRQSRDNTVADESMLSNVLDDVFGSVEPTAPEATAPPSAPRNPPSQRTMSDAAGDVIDRQASGLANLGRGIDALLGRSTLRSGPAITEEAYQKAKPFFIEAARDFADSWTSVKELLTLFIKALKEKLGLSREDIEKVAPHVIRFVNEVKDGTIDLNAPPVSEGKDQPTEPKKTTVDEILDQYGVTTEVKNHTTSFGKTQLSVFLTVPDNLVNSIGFLEAKYGFYNKGKNPSIFVTGAYKNKLNAFVSYLKAEFGINISNSVANKIGQNSKDAAKTREQVIRGGIAYAIAKRNNIDLETGTSFSQEGTTRPVRNSSNEVLDALREQIRRAVSGLRVSNRLASEQRDAGHYRGLVSGKTIGLLERGLDPKIGMPRHVVDWQIEDVGRALDNYNNGKPGFLLSSDPGSGKTFTAGGFIRDVLAKDSKTRILYFTTNRTLIDQIKNSDLKDFGLNNRVDFITYAMIQNERNADISHEAGKSVIAFRDDFIEVNENTVIIFDEAHKIKNILGDGYGAYNASKLMRNGKFSFYMSATPFESPSETMYLENSGLFSVYDQIAKDNGFNYKGIQLTGFQMWAIEHGAELKKEGKDRFKLTVNWPGLPKYKATAGQSTEEREQAIRDYDARQFEFQLSQFEMGRAARDWFIDYNIMSHRPIDLGNLKNGQPAVVNEIVSVVSEVDYDQFYNPVSAIFDAGIADPNLDKNLKTMIGMQRDRVKKRMAEYLKLKEVSKAIIEDLKKSPNRKAVVFVKVKSPMTFGKAKVWNDVEDKSLEKRIVAKINAIIIGKRPGLQAIADGKYGKDKNRAVSELDKLKKLWAGKKFTYTEMLEAEREWSAYLGAEKIDERTGLTENLGLFSSYIKYMAEAFENSGLDLDKLSLGSPVSFLREYLEPVFGSENIVEYNGSLSNEQNIKNRENWKKSGSGPRIIIATMDKGGTGLSLHDTNGDRQTFQYNIAIPDTSTEFEQVSGRIARYGLQSQANIRWFFAQNMPDDYDYRWAKILQERLNNQQAIVKGSLSETTQNLNAENVLGQEQRVLSAITSDNLKLDNATPILPQLATGEDATNHLINNGSTPAVREIAAKIAPFVKGVQIHYVKAGDQLPAHLASKLSRSNGVAHMDEDGNVTIYLRTDQNLGRREVTVAHELIHAATMRALQENPEIAKELESIRRKIVGSLASENGGPIQSATTRELHKTLQAVITNPDELLAYAFSSQDFQQLLSQIGADGRWLGDYRTPAEREAIDRNANYRAKPLAEVPQRSLWQLLVDTVRRLFGLQPRFQAAINQIVAGNSKIAEENAKRSKPDFMMAKPQIEKLLDRLLAASKKEGTVKPGTKPSIASIDNLTAKDYQAAGDALRQIGKNPDLFRTKKPTAKGMDQIAKEVAPKIDIKVSRPDRNTPHRAFQKMEWSVDITMPDGHMGHVFKNGKEVWIDASDFEANDSNYGWLMWQIAGGFAFNNGFKLVGDVALSAPGKARDIEHMISLVMKYGTTQFIEPHESHNLDWTEDDGYNFAQLLKKSADLVISDIPEIEDMRYDIGNRQFIDGDGRPVSTERLAGLARERFPSKEAIKSRNTRPGAAFAGTTTLKRAILHNTLVQGARGTEWGKLLAESLSLQDSGVGGSPLEVTYYSRTTTDATGLSRGGFVSAIKKAFPHLSTAIDKVLARGERGEKGGTVLVDSADIDEIARVYAEKTGRSFEDAKAGIQASVRSIDELLKQAKYFGLTPGAKWNGVGKEMGGAIYVSRKYIDRIPQAIQDQIKVAEKHLPADFAYTHLKYIPETGAVSFQLSRDFDTATEPTVNVSYLVKPDGSVTRTPRTGESEQQIWHHKWMWVDQGYKGFDYAEAVQRSIDWNMAVERNKEALLEKTQGKPIHSKIGSKSFWESEIVPLVQSTWGTDLQQELPATWELLSKLGYKPENASNTQIANTRKTYVKVATDNIPKSHKVLDYSAGLGYGTADMRAAGWNVDDYEPFSNPGSRDHAPMFSRLDATDIPNDAYDTVLNQFVLNVVPEETRRVILSSIYQKVKPGGQAIILVRGWSRDVDQALKQGIVVGPEEILTSKRTFQKGFTYESLTELVKQVLPGAEIVGKPKSNALGIVLRKPANKAQPKTQTQLQFSKTTGKLQGFYDPRSGLVFAILPNLSEESAPGVFLHETKHSQQRLDITRRAVDLINQRANFKAPMRGFLDRVFARLAAAGAVNKDGVITDLNEVAPYIVEQAVMEGQQNGFNYADGKFLDWVDAKIGKPVGDLIRKLVNFVRAAMIRRGWNINTAKLSVDDLVNFAKVGVERAAEGKVRTVFKAEKLNEGKNYDRTDRRNLIDQAIQLLSPDAFTSFVSGILPKEQVSGAMASRSGTKVSGESSANTSRPVGLVDDGDYIPIIEREIGAVLRSIALYDKNNNNEPTAKELADAIEQYQSVIDKFKDTPQWMKAPNGEPTKLNERQWIQVQTENFKKWFDGSKVVDENGDPMVVYHGGSFNENIHGTPDTQGKPKKGWQLIFGMHFSENKDEAIPYITGKQGVLTEAFVRSKNPLFLTPDVSNDGKKTFHPITSEMYANMPVSLKKKYDQWRKKWNQTNETGYTEFLESLLDKMKPSDAKDIVLEMGFDGVAYTARANYGNGGYRKFNAYIALKPNQIKSAIGNVGTFGETDDIRYSNQPSETFYSGMSRAIEAMPQKKAPGPQWASILDNLAKKGQVKQEEIDWTGISEWLQEQKRQVTKEELLGKIAENEITVEENQVTPRHAERTLNGGENHRELVLSVPTITPWENGGKPHYSDIAGGRVVAWVRFNDRVDENGNKTLFIEEIQSQRHEDGRQVGYRYFGMLNPDQLTMKYTEDGGEITGGPAWEFEDKDGNFVYSLEGEFNQDPDQALAAAKKKFDESPAILDRSRMNSNRPGNAPFKATISGSNSTLSGWAGLSFKRMIRYAAENGYQNIAWTTGDQQVARYPQYRGTIAEGMRGFYDRLLPNEINKYVKKWGAKVGTTTIKVNGEGKTVHSVDVTPEMVASVMQGQPLFSRKSVSQPRFMDEVTNEDIPNITAQEWSSQTQNEQLASIKKAIALTDKSEKTARRELSKLNKALSAGQKIFRRNEYMDKIKNLINTLFFNDIGDRFEVRLTGTTKAPDVLRGRVLRASLDNQDVMLMPPTETTPRYIVDEQLLEVTPASKVFKAVRSILPIAGDKSSVVTNLSKLIDKVFPDLDQNTDEYHEPFGGGLLYLNNLDVLRNTEKPIYISVSRKHGPERYAFYHLLKNNKNGIGDRIIADLQKALETEVLPKHKIVRYAYNVISRSKTRFDQIINNPEVLREFTAMLRKDNVFISPNESAVSYAKAAQAARSGRRVTLIDDSNYARLFAENPSNQYLNHENDDPLDPQYQLDSKRQVYDAVRTNNGHVIATNNMSVKMIQGLVDTYGDNLNLFGFRHAARHSEDTEINFYRPTGGQDFIATARPEYVALIGPQRPDKEVINNVQILETGNITRPSRTGRVWEDDDGKGQAPSVTGEGSDYTEGTGLLSEPASGGINSKVAPDSLQDTQDGRPESATGRFGVRHSRTQTPPTSGVSASKVAETLITPKAALWRHAGLTVKVVQSADEIPEENRPEGIESSEGFYDPATQTVYLIASNLSSMERAQEVLRHEVVGHYASLMLRDTVEWNGILRNIGRLEQLGNAKVVSAAAWVDKNSPELKENPARRQEEIFAVLVERGEHNQIGMFKSLVDRILTKIKEWLKLLGLDSDWVNNQTFSEVMAWARASEQGIESGQLTRGQWNHLGMDQGVRSSITAIAMMGKNNNEQPTAAELAEAQRQYDDVVARFKGTDQWMKAPNGEPTKLNERQWIQVQTENFKKWFDGSKVVDENGDPMVVYHGTETEFNSFDNNKIGSRTDPGFFGAGFYFTPSEDTAQRWGKYAMPVFISLKNPLLVSGMSEFTKKTGMVSTNNPKLTQKKNTELFEKEINRITNLLKKEGYDGVIRTDSKGIKWPVAFNSTPDQIKSANGNVGTFSKTNSDIRHSRSNPRDLTNPDTARKTFDDIGQSLFDQNSEPWSWDRLWDIIRNQFPRGLGFLTRQQLIEMASSPITGLGRKLLPSAEFFENAAALMDGAKSRIKRDMYDGLVEQWQRETGKNRKLAYAFDYILHGSTFQQVDPTQPMREQHTNETDEAYAEKQKWHEILTKKLQDLEKQSPILADIVGRVFANYVAVNDMKYAAMKERVGRSGFEMVRTAMERVKGMTADSKPVQEVREALETLKAASATDLKVVERVYSDVRRAHYQLETEQFRVDSPIQPNEHVSMTAAKKGYQAFTPEQKKIFKARRSLAQASHSARLFEFQQRDPAQYEKLVQLITSTQRRAINVLVDRVSQKSWVPEEKAAMHQELRKLPADAQTLFRDMNHTYKVRQSYMMSSIDLYEQAARMLKPYAPLTRYGKYEVFAERQEAKVDQKGQPVLDKDGAPVMERKIAFTKFETIHDQKKAAKLLKADGWTVSTDYQIIRDRISHAPSGTFIGDMFGFIDESVANPKERDALKESMYSLYLENLPDLSVRKHLLKRSNVFGYNRDALRAYGQFMNGSANMIARLRYADVLSEQLYQMEQEVTELSEHENEQAKAGAILNELVQSYDWLMNPSNSTWANRMTALGFIWYLTNPSTAIINLSQIPLLTFPALAAKFNGWSAFKQIKRAVLDYGRVINRVRQMGWNPLNPPMALKASRQVTDANGQARMEIRYLTYKNEQEYLKTIKKLEAEGYEVDRAVTPLEAAIMETLGQEYDGDMTRFLEFLEKSGRVSRSATTQLAGLGEDSWQNQDNAKGKFSRGASMALAAGSFLFHHSEVANREITALAAYRLMRDKLKNLPREQAHQQAQEYAYNSVSFTQGDYSNASRARLMRGDWMRVISLFKTFSQMMTWRLLRDMYQSRPFGKGVDPAERAESRERFGWMMMNTVLLGGIMGLPMYTMVVTMVNAIQALNGDPDDPWDFELWMNQRLAEILGDQGRQIVMTGPVGSATGTAISQRLSLDLVRMWVRKVPGDLEGTALVNAYVQQALGPAFGLAFRGGQGMKDLMHGIAQGNDDLQSRGAEALLPAPLANLAKSWRFVTNGVQTRRGDKLVDDLSTGQAITQAIGFQPKQIFDVYQQNDMLFEEKTQLERRARDLIAGYVYATENNDIEGRNEFQQAIAKYNQKNPLIAIKPQQIQNMLKQRRIRNQKSEGGMYVPSRNMRQVLDKERYIQ